MHPTRHSTSRDERLPFVVGYRVLPKTNLSIRRNGRPGTLRHKASISSIKSCPNMLWIGSYWLEHVKHTQWDVEIRHVVPLESLEVSQENSSDGSAGCPDQSLPLNAVLHPQAKPHGHDNPDRIETWSRSPRTMIL